MTKIDRPQEENSVLEGQKKVMYVTNVQGQFERVNYGSSAEEFATKTAVEEFEQLVQDTIIEIQAGTASPIKYFMNKNRMDISTLASVVGMFSFRVKRHLMMKHFKKLNDKILQRYCDAFGITLKELKDLKV